MNKCPGCQRHELHKMCPAHGTPFYMSGLDFTKEVEYIYRSFINFSDEVRLLIMNDFCKHCGSKELPCYCWNDE